MSIQAGHATQRADHSAQVNVLRQRVGRRTSTDFIESLLHSFDAASRTSVAVATRSAIGWEELTYAELDLRSRQVRTWLNRAGVEAEDRVALIGESSGDWVAGLFGILRAGAIAVPLDASLTGHELDSLEARAPWGAILVSRQHQHEVDELVTRRGRPVPVLVLEEIVEAGFPAGSDVPRRTDDVALLVWTAGTTGRAKGVCLTFTNLDHVVTRSVAEQDATSRDRWLSVLALNHMLELSCGLLACLRTAATMTFARSQMPHEIVAAMIERRTTRMVVVPLLLRLLAPTLAQSPQAASRLHALYSGGAPVPPDALSRYAALNIPVYQGYGLTELAPVVAMNSPRHNRPGSVGRPLEGVDVRIESGEILVRSPGLMAGYWDDAVATRRAVDPDGWWFHTGDLGELDADGYLYITGRVKNLVVLESGKKVSAEEVEEALAASDMFAEVCVVALPFETRRGSTAEQVCAVVVPTPAARVRFGDELAEAVEAEVRRCARVLSGYKCPTVVEIVNAPLPKTIKFSVRRTDVLTMIRNRREGGA